MIENDLPQGILKEEKYKKIKSKLKTAAFIVWGMTLLIAGAIVATVLINSSNVEPDNSSSQVTQETEKNLAIKQELADIESEIDTEKKAIFPTYKTTSSYGPGKVGWDEYERITNALDVVNLKYVDDVQAIVDKAALDQTVNGDNLDFSISYVKDQLDNKNKTIVRENESELSRSEFKSKFESSKMLAALPVLLMGGMIGLMLMIVAHQREIAAYGMQGTLPVASEGMGKMVKSLDDNGTLDIIAETGAKMMGKQAEAQIKHNVPQKQAELEKAQVEAQNEAGATKLSAKQKGAYAEEVGKGLKKGLFKK